MLQTTFWTVCLQFASSAVTESGIGGFKLPFSVKFLGVNGLTDKLKTQKLNIYFLIKVQEHNTTYNNSRTIYTKFLTSRKISLAIHLNFVQLTIR